VLALLLLVGLALVVAGVFLWTDYHLRAARLAADRGHNAEAIDHLRRCRQLRPDQPEVLLLSARVARRSGAWNETETLLDRYWQLYGDDEALVLERLLFQATRGEVEAAQPLLQAHIAQNDPAAPLAREALIAGLLYRYNLEEADRHITRWLAHDPNSSMALFLQGKLQEIREQTSQALRTYRRLLEIDPEHDEARLRMTTLLLQLSQGEEALTHLEYLRRRLPDHAEVPVQLAQAWTSSGGPTKPARSSTNVSASIPTSRPRWPSAAASRCGTETSTEPKRT
jgi:tetratricopeptide (TPR) repeat protein